MAAGTLDDVLGDAALGGASDEACTQRMRREALGPSFKKTVKFADLVPDQVDIDDLIQSRPRILAEEVLAMGKIRIQYRGELELKDFQEARDHFESKLKD